MIMLYQHGSPDAGWIDPSASYTNSGVDQDPLLGHSGSSLSPSAIYKDLEETVLHQVWRTTLAPQIQPRINTSRGEPLQ